MATKATLKAIKGSIISGGRYKNFRAVSPIVTLCANVNRVKILTTSMNFLEVITNAMMNSIWSSPMRIW